MRNIKTELKYEVEVIQKTDNNNIVCKFEYEDENEVKELLEKLRKANNVISLKINEIKSTIIY